MTDAPAHNGRATMGSVGKLCGLSVAVGIILVIAGDVQAEGKLVFRPLMHQPRIYQGAPAGVHVTTVHAYDPDKPRKRVIYNLPNVLEYDNFVLDQASGNLTTAKQINKTVGENYQVMVTAVSFGLSELEHLQVAVTEFNQFAPRFKQSAYKAEVAAQAPIETQVLQVQAHDPDEAPANAEIYYRMDPSASTHFFALDSQSGWLTLARPLNASEPSLQFGVFAEDGGSPKRWAHVHVEVLLKSISAPEDIKVSNVTVSTAIICWSLPEFGDVSGYLFNYHVLENEEYEELNITSDELETCTTLSDLQDGTDYEFHILGWNPEDTGQRTETHSFTTVLNRCLQSVCKTGECTTLNADPWYSCDCPDGYYGTQCEFFNPCSRSPCGNNGTCLNTTSNEYVCTCHEDYTGPNCGSYNPCLRRNPLCQNGGTCQVTTNNTYVCLCIDGYYGRRCRNRNLCYSGPCLNGGTCTNMSDTTFTCTCPPGLTGDLCGEDVDECASNPCHEGATCVNHKGNFTCTCAPGYTGHICVTPKQCPQDRTDTDRGMFYWNATQHSIQVMVRCPFGNLDAASTGFAARSCLLTSNGTVRWSPVDAASCRGKGFVVAEELAGELHSLTHDPSTLNAERLEAAAQGIESISTFAAQDKKLAQDMVNVISNVLKVNSTVIDEDENGTLSDSLLQIVDDFASDMALKRGESLNVDTENIRIHAVRWHPDDALQEAGEESLRFDAPSMRNTEPAPPDTVTTAAPSLSHLPGQEEVDVSHENERAKEEVQMMQVFVPHEALHEAHRQLQHDVRVKFVVYYNDKLFQPRKDFSEAPGSAEERAKSITDEATAEESEPVINTPVLQISVGNISLSNLYSPLIYIFPMVTKKKVQCVYWKEKAREWSTYGLTTNHTERMVICKSTHLTAFSVLLDPTPGVGISVEHQQALSLISYIGCALSLLGLSLTILTYSLFRCLNRDHPGKILLNLCVSLLLMNLTFLLGALQPPNGKNVCAVVALLIHYFLLTSLAWMCVEAVNMYQLLVHVFASAETHFLLKRCLIAWGGPLLVVAITVTVGLKEYYNQNSFCMLSPRNPWVYYFAFLGPCCFMLAINVTVFVLVSRVLFTPRLTSQTVGGAPPTVTAAQVRGAFTVMVLLGVTWVFGTFAVGEAKLLFQYIFCVTNSLQGFLIFLVRCLHYPEARSAWLQLIKSGKLKKYRGVLPPGAVSWSTNSQSKPHTSTSTGGESDTTGTVVFNSNFWNRMSAHDSRRSDGKIAYLRNSNVSGLKCINNFKEPNGKSEEWSSPRLNNFSGMKCQTKRDNGSFGVKADWQSQNLSAIGNHDNTDQYCHKTLVTEEKNFLNQLTENNELRGDETVNGHKNNDQRENKSKERKHVVRNKRKDRRSASVDVAYGGYNSSKPNTPGDVRDSIKGLLFYQKRRSRDQSTKGRRSASLDACTRKTKRKDANINKDIGEVNKCDGEKKATNQSKQTQIVQTKAPVIIERDDDGPSEDSTSTDVDDSPVECLDVISQESFAVSKERKGCDSLDDNCHQNLHL